jgi:branched-chain amino acid transport system permease protein
VGSAILLVAQNYLQDLMRLAGKATANIPLLRDLVNPDRWLLWLGLLFILSVYRFPTGIVGKLRIRAWLKRQATGKA